MRISEEISRVGYFWLPSSPERKLPGVIRVFDGGRIRLEIVGLFHAEDEKSSDSFNANITIGMIHGSVEEFGPVTLSGCFYLKKQNSFDSVFKSLVSACEMFVGVTLPVDDRKLFNTFKFSVDGICEWIGIDGFKFENNSDKGFCVKISYEMPESISINLCNGMKLLIGFSCVTPGFPILTEAKITQKTYFTLTTEFPCDLFDFISVAYKITNFVGFAVDDVVCIDSVVVSSNEFIQRVNNDLSRSVPIAVYYSSLPYVKTPPVIDVYSMLFGFMAIADDAEKLINNWILAYDTIGPALDLYFFVKVGGNKYAEGKFLALIQGLETYHRRTSKEKLMNDEVFDAVVETMLDLCPDENKQWLSGRLRHGNEINLAARIKKIIRPFNNLIGNADERAKFIRYIVDTRNYLTHYDESLSSKAVKGVDLWCLCRKLDAIFQLHLLVVIGFSKETIDYIFGHNEELRRKLGNHPAVPR